MSRYHTLVATLLLVLALAHASRIIFPGHLKRALSPRVTFQSASFVALILATSQDQVVQYVCSGTIINKDSFAHILTTAYCIQDREDAAGAPVSYIVLVEDPNGTINLGLHNFTAFDVRQRFFHPNASATATFRFISQWPNGTQIGFNVGVAPYDLGILRLNSSITVSAATPATLGTVLPQAGAAVSFLGYGGPQFFTLGATTGTRVLQSVEVVNNNEVANTKLVIMHDVREDVPANATQAVEPGDEGGPIVDSSLRVVGVVQGSWQVNTEETGLLTFATLGTAVPENLAWIRSVTGTTPNSPGEEPPVVGAGAFNIMPHIALLLGLWALLKF